jgi:adenylosuccinate synthase
MGQWETAKYALNFSNAIRIKNLGDPDILNQIIDVADGIYRSSLEDGCTPDDWDDAFAEDNFTERCILAEVYQSFVEKITVVNDEKCKELINDSETIIFEGAQGVLLDKDRGFLPYVSATDTTCTLAEEFLKRISYDGKIVKIGIIRSYLTRHGNGPLPNEVKGIKLVGEDNQYNDFQGAFRVGQMDIALVEHALTICPVDELFITCLDNDPFDMDTTYLSRAITLARKLNKKLYGYSYGKDRSRKRTII